MNPLGMSIACLLSLLPGPPGIEFENAYLQLLPMDKYKCSYINPHYDVRFRLYTRDNPIRYELLRYGDDTALASSHIDFSRHTVIYFHAFLESPDSESGTLIREAYILRGDTNVIMVDGQRLEAGPWYNTAAENTWFIGQFAARFIDYLVSRGLDLSNTHLIGHSLGGQSAGVAGGALRSGKVARITGLDPAKPLFTHLPLHQQLDASDAHYVDIIHTDAGIFGIQQPMGHADYYPNGGASPQPGCELKALIGRGLMLEKGKQPTEQASKPYFIFTLEPKSKTIKKSKKLPSIFKRKLMDHLRTAEPFKEHSSDQEISYQYLRPIVIDANRESAEPIVKYLGSKMEARTKKPYNERNDSENSKLTSNKDVNSETALPKIDRVIVFNPDAEPKESDQIILKVNPEESTMPSIYVTPTHDDGRTIHSVEESTLTLQLMSATEMTTELTTPSKLAKTVLIKVSNKPSPLKTANRSIKHETHRGPQMMEEITTQRDSYLPIEDDFDQATITNGELLSILSANQALPQIGVARSLGTEEIPMPHNKDIQLPKTTELPFNIDEAPKLMITTKVAQYIETTTVNNLQIKIVNTSDTDDNISQEIQTDQKSQVVKNNQKSEAIQTGQKPHEIQIDQKLREIQTQPKSEEIQTDQTLQIQNGRNSKEIQTEQKSQTIHNEQESKTNESDNRTDTTTHTIQIHETTKRSHDNTPEESDKNEQTSDEATKQIKDNMRKNLHASNANRQKRQRVRRFIQFFRKQSSPEEEQNRLLMNMLEFLFRYKKNILPVVSVMREVSTAIRNGNRELSHSSKEKNNYIGTLGPPNSLPSYQLELGKEPPMKAFIKKILGFGSQSDNLVITG